MSARLLLCRKRRLPPLRRPLLPRLRARSPTNHRLRWYEKNQQTIRAELYQNLADAVSAQDGDGAIRAGKRVVLPSSFTGGVRDMGQRYHDGMACVRKKGKPSFFITMTCNPCWEEIMRELNHGEQPQDRPDLVARVFKLKLKQLCDELFNDGIFGRVVAHLHVIEFQKRGLQHAHIIVILHEDDRLKTVDDIDACVSAELPVAPDPADYGGDASSQTYLDAYARFEELTELIVSHLTHHGCGPAFPGASCMVDGQCKAGYDKKTFLAATTYQESQIYPMYRRRAPEDGGATYTTRTGRVIDNRSVVPHSPYLVKKYKCHLNVEVCFSVASVKYLYKYVYKGPDRAMVAVRAEGDVDEIALFQDMRSFGSAEGCWRTFDFEMSGRAPPIVRLPAHLEGRQNCRYEEGSEAATVARGAPATELTAWFDYIKTHPEARQPTAARAMTDASPAVEAWSAKYPDFPERYRFDKQEKKWLPRKKMDAFGYIGRVYHVHHGAGGIYYLRMLLHHVPACDLALAFAPDGESAEAAATRVADAFSFDAFKYHDGVKLATYKAVCTAHGLLQDDKEWDDMLADACTHAMPPAIRRLFVYVLAFNQPLDPMALFDKYCADMGEDYARQLHVARNALMVRARVLLDLEERLERAGQTFWDCNMVFTDEERELAAEALHATARSTEPKEIQDELPEDVARVQAAFETAYAELLPRQCAPVDAALAAIESNTGLGLFIDAPGGTGKTFSANCLLNAVRAKGEIALAVASSGIAAILLELGRTFHSRCKASLKPAPDQVLNIAAQSVTAQLFRRAKLILWDEGAMGNRYHLEALDRTLRDLMKTVDPDLEHVPFGGKVVVIGGVRGGIQTAADRSSPFRPTSQSGRPRIAGLPPNAACGAACEQGADPRRHAHALAALGRALPGQRLSADGEHAHPKGGRGRYRYDRAAGVRCVAAPPRRRLGAARRAREHHAADRPLARAVRAQRRRRGQTERMGLPEFAPRRAGDPIAARATGRGRVLRRVAL